MKFYDAFEMGVFNLRRAILRTILTTLGVIIGIGTLSSMISFGAGMEENITDVFRKNDLFTSLYITKKQIDIDKAMSGDVGGVMKDMAKKEVPLNDSTLGLIREIEEVEIAFPEIRIPVNIILDSNETKTSIRALPSDMSKYPPFDDIEYGSFIPDDTSKSIVVSERILRELNFVLKTEERTELSKEDSSEGMVLIEPDSVLGREIGIVTASYSRGGMGSPPAPPFGDDNQSSEMNEDNTPFEKKTSKFIICGITKAKSGINRGRFDFSGIISLANSKEIPRVEFTNIWDLLSDESKESSYNSIYVRVESISDMDTVTTQLEELGFNTMSLADQLGEIKDNFIIVDGILAAIGIISLIIAGLGIINTMVMSILERKKEIGIMKAIGGGEKDIRNIFFVEASIIGLMGGALGLLLGWGVTEIASLVIKAYLIPAGDKFTDLFYFPFWLIGGAMLFSLCISLLAGLYPAYRAARIDPVKALRHE